MSHLKFNGPFSWFRQKELSIILLSLLDRILMMENLDFWADFGFRNVNFLRIIIFEIRHLFNMIPWHGNYLNLMSIEASVIAWSLLVVARYQLHYQPWRQKQGLIMTYHLINWLQKNWLISDLVSLIGSTFLQSDHSRLFSGFDQFRLIRMRGKDGNRREAKSWRHTSSQ